MTRPGSAVTPNLPVIREAVLPPVLQTAMQAGQLQPGTQYFRMGKLRILVSPPHRDQGWHMSISHNRRYPAWDEVAKARYELVPDEVTMAMLLPSRDEYVNLYEFTFHLHQIER